MSWFIIIIVVVVVIVIYSKEINLHIVLQFLTRSLKSIKKIWQIDFFGFDSNIFEARL